MKIVTHNDYPPIPYRGFDWSCVDDDAYSPCDDLDCPCHASIGNTVGFGETEELAIIDYVRRLCWSNEIGEEHGN